MPLLWNLQTQAPEFVEIDQVPQALASGTYRTYEGSESVRPAGPTAGTDLGVQVNELDPVEMERLAGGAPTIAPSVIAAEDAEAQRRAKLDTLGNEALTFADGVISGVTAGLIDPANASPEAAELAEINPWARGAGVVTGIVGPALLSGGSSTAAQVATKTPAGAIARLGAKAAEKVGGSLVRREAVAGAVESAAYATGSQVGAALWTDRPVSAEAIVSEMTLGGILGGVLGSAAVGARQVVTKADEVAKARQGVFDITNPTSSLSRGITDELRSAGGSWDAAAEGARARLNVLDEAMRRGDLPPEIEGFVNERWVAMRGVDDARARLMVALGGKKGGNPWERLEQVLANGKARRVQDVAEALDAYGNAVSRLDDAMKPRDWERALAPTPTPVGATPISPGRYEPTGNWETPAAAPAQAAQVAQAVDPNATPVIQRATPNAGYAGPMTPGGTGIIRQQNPTVKIPRGNTVKIGEAPAAAAPPAPAPQPAQMGAVPRGQAVRDFVAAPPLNMGPRSTDLGVMIQGHMAKLDELFGDASLSSGALNVAEEAGVDLARVSGPLAERAVALWGIRKMAKDAIKVAKGGRGTASESLLQRAAAAGAGRLAAPLGHAVAGAPGASAMYALTSGAVRFGMRFAGNVGAAAAKTKENVARAVDKALAGGRRVRPVSRALTAIRASYDPEISSEAGSRDFKVKAEQLRTLAANPDALRLHVREQVKDLAKMDPMLAAKVEEVAVNRVVKLAARLPAFMAHGHPLVDPTKAPLQTQAVREWELYEAVTANPALAWEFVSAGMVPKVVAEALREQHPEQFAEMVKQVLADPDRLRKADPVMLQGISSLIGFPLTPGADPRFVSRQQARFAEQRASQQELQMRQQGASALRGGLHGRPVPTPGQAAAQGPIGNR